MTDDNKAVELLPCPFCGHETPAISDNGRVPAMTSLSDNERKLLLAMHENHDSEYDEFCGPNGAGVCFSFKGLANICPQLPAHLIRRTVRALARKGLVAYEKGLWCDDRPAGAGYGIIEAGRLRAEQELSE